jgi:hypothetical protein
MTKRKVEIGIDIDSREAVRNLSKVADEAREVEDALDDDVTSAAKAVADAMERSAADMIDEIDATRRAVDALDAALGDTDVDTTKVVGDLKKIGLTAEEIEDDADALARALRKSGDVKVHATTQGFEDLGDAVNRTDSDLIEAGDRYQSLGSAVRGVTDELGFASPAVNSFAIGALDAGDVAVQMGEKFGLSADAAGKLGTVLGGAGIAAVIAGTAIPAVMALMDNQDALAENTKDVAREMAELTGVVEEFDRAVERVQETDPLVAAILGSMEGDELDDFTQGLRDTNTQIEDLPGLLDAVERSGGLDSFIDRQLRGLEGWNDLTQKQKDKVVELIGENEHLRDVQAKLLVDSETEAHEFLRHNDDKVRSIQDVSHALTNLDPDRAYQILLEDVGLTEGGILKLRDAQKSLQLQHGHTQHSAREIWEEMQRLENVSIKATDAATEGNEDIEESADDAAAAVDDITSAFQEMRDEISDDQAIIDIEEAFIAAEKAAAEAWTAAADGAEDAEQAARDYRSEQNSLKQEVIDYAEEVGKIPAETVSEILTLIDQGSLADAEARLAALSADRHVRINLQRGSGVTFNATGGSAGPIQFRDRGGPMDAGASYLVGEKGPELVTPSRQGWVHRPDQTADMLGAGAQRGGDINITVNATGAAASSPAAVAREIAWTLKTTGE